MRLKSVDWKFFIHEKVMVEVIDFVMIRLRICHLVCLEGNDGCSLHVTELVNDDTLNQCPCFLSTLYLETTSILDSELSRNQKQDFQFFLGDRNFTTWFPVSFHVVLVVNHAGFELPTPVLCMSPHA